MHWIYQNINHITSYFVIVLGLMTAVGVQIDQRRKKAGQEGIGRGYRAAFLIILVFACIVFGMSLAYRAA